ncbi:MAG: hypothetical protein RSF40_12070 [Oscillospiraceae bacterium]
MTIGKILMLSPSFPPSHTVHDSFPSHGVPSGNVCWNDTAYN